MSCRIPRCSECGKKMFKVKAKNIDFHYYDCEKGCCFHRVVWEEELTENEKIFLDNLINNKK